VLREAVEGARRAGQRRKKGGGKGRKRERKKEGEKKIGKREKKKGKRKEEKRKIGKRRRKGFRNLGEFLGKFGGRRKGILRGFPVSGVSVIFGTAVMARRTGRWDRGVSGIPGVVADSGAGWHAVGDGPSSGGAGGIRGTRAEGERGERWPGFRRG
jgi:hypothetical protein